MPVKRKRAIEDFDPNKSDSDDENFDPGEDARRGIKRSRPSKGGKSSSGRRRSNKYRGSDIEDDEELSDSQEDSFADDDEFEEDDGDPIVNAAGRRARKAAVAHVNYKESSGSEVDEELVEDSEPEEPKKESKIIKLKVPKKEATTSAPPTRRSTRAQTEDAEEDLVELSTSGRHAQPARSSRSRSPETAARAAKSSRAMKGLKKNPTPIDEATQESSVPKQEDPDEDELAKEPEAAGENADVEAENAETEDAVMDSVIEEPENEGDGAEADDDDDAPITRRTRASRASVSAAAEEEPAAEEEAEPDSGKRRRLRSGLRKNPQEPSSDFEPGDDESEADKSGSDSSDKNDDNGDDGDDSPMPQRGRGRPKRQSAKSSRRGEASADEIELDQDELAEELHELRQDSRSRSHRRRSPPILYQEEPAKRRRAATRPISYYMPPLTSANIEEEEVEDPAPNPARRRGGRGGASQAWERALNTTFGPFGGGGGAGSLLGGPWGTGATGGVDSDSSDDERPPRPGPIGPGMTPTTAVPPGGMMPGLGAPLGMDGLAGIGGAAPNVGKIKNQKVLADADPLGVDLTVDFGKVGGLQGHIDQLKEMVQLPLLYPELFLRFHVTPPRGVLFHGPPGTGKTLLARALANSIGSGGRKITFYMRKGADALSKWVGEAEKQLRLLFEEARRTQPSIIFFDEIDGLAPVRSSKQEQIHASIVSTLLALMDGMDGRGQVIVIGATNRPDNIDPALRRPGRFDREFYFPLPDVQGRRSIIDIHTKDWGLSDEFKNSLAENTKGYAGADLRALCTEAALNSIQRTYPQIYSSKEKLIVDPEKISIHSKDFMLSIKSMVPSSERSASSGAAALPRSIEPLLRDQLREIEKALDQAFPRKKKLTALEEAMYESPKDADHGFGREVLQQEFERSRIFRPRFLIHGASGMGQNYLSSAILHYFEGVHVQNFDLASLLSDGRPMEQVIVGKFAEVKRHKPSVIYIPNVDSWYATMRESVGFTTFLSMLRSIAPTDPILLLATADCDGSELPQEIIRDFFGYSKKNRMEIRRPQRNNRREYFQRVASHIGKSPSDFPDPVNRKKRVLEELPIAPAPAPKPPSKGEINAIKKRDHQLLNALKVQLQPIMDQINRKYKKFRQPVIPYTQLQYLFDESDPNYVRPDLAEGQVRPFEIVKDKHDVDVLRETATGKCYYNLETTTIEERLSNGFYARPKDFLYDIKTLAKDAKNIGDKERTLKANELVSNVEVDVASIEANSQAINWEELYQRQIQRAKEAAEKGRKRKVGLSILSRVQSDIAGNDSDSQGPVTLGEPVPGSRPTTARFQVMSPLSNGQGAGSGSHELSNGTGQQQDVQMGGTEEETQENPEHASPMKPPSQWPRMEAKSADQSGEATAGTTQLSQRSAFVTVPPGVSPSQMVNDASTTKTSDPSERSSGKWSTMATNGFHSDQQFSPLENSSSQMPDTQVVIPASQGTSAGSPWPHSQAHGLALGSQVGGGSGSPPSSQQQGFSSKSSSGPKSHAPSIGNLLNDGDDSIRNSGSSGSQGSQPPLIVNHADVQRFLMQLTDGTSGFTIEQLEQLNRELMDEVWRSRQEWNRVKVLNSLMQVFNETVQDIESMQGVLDLSQSRNNGL